MSQCTNLNIVLMFLGLIYQNHAKVIINIRLYNYRNVDNLRHDGQKCEHFHWAGDHCDPMFKICVTATNRCDIVSKQINSLKNHKTLYTVYSRNIPFKKLPKSISINVQVDDHDSLDVHDHIAVFTADFQINNLYFEYQKIMNIQPKGLNIGLQSSVMVKCEKNYFGPTCDDRLDQYNCNISCRHGQCVLNKKDTYYCKCESGWSDINCNKFTTDNCSLLNCKKECNVKDKLRECTCDKIDFETRMCSEKYLPRKVISTEAPIVSKSTQSSTVYTKSTLNLIKTISARKIPKSTSQKSQIANNTESSKISSTQVFNNSKSQKNHDAFVEDNIMKSYFTPSTIIIVCLFLLMCIFMIGLVVVIQNWKRKTNTKLMHVTTLQRPLPPIFYEKKLLTEKSKFQDNDNSTIFRKTNLETESCTIPFGFNGRDSNLFLINKYDMDTVDIYEEPIINNMESLTCETEANESDDSDLYERPLSSKR